MQKKCAKTFKKLEKKGEDLEKELEKTKSSAKMDLSTDDTIEAHHKKKEIDLEAFAAKKKVEHQLQEKKKAKMKKTMSKCFGDAKTLYMSGRSFSDRHHDCRSSRHNQRSKEQEPRPITLLTFLLLRPEDQEPQPITLFTLLILLLLS